MHNDADNKSLKCVPTVSYTHLDVYKRQVVNVLRDAGAEVLGIASIFTYGLQKGLDRLKAADVKNVSLSNYDALIEAAMEENYIQADQIKKLQAFRRNPSDPSWMTI